MLDGTFKLGAAQLLEQRNLSRVIGVVLKQADDRSAKRHRLAMCVDLRVADLAVKPRVLEFNKGPREFTVCPPQFGNDSSP